MSCVRRVTSNDSDLASFITKSELPIYQSHCRGDIRGKKLPYTDSGFSCDVSERDFNDLTGQIADALSFLQRHEAELRALRAEHDIKDMTLDFPTWLRIGNETITQFEYFPPSLLKICGDLGLGIEISIYPKSQGE